MLSHFLRGWGLGRTIFGSRLARNTHLRSEGWAGRKQSTLLQELRSNAATLWQAWRGRTTGPSRGYKAFISYNHVASKSFAIQLETALKAYAKPTLAWPIRIFRDERHLAPGIDLPTLIIDALDASEFLILLASPEAAGSPWVQDEVERWCGTLGRSKNLIIVLIAGEIAFSEETKRIDWMRTDSLPSVLQAYLDLIPFYADLRQVALTDDLTLADPTFKECINGITARFRKIEPNDMLGEEVLQHRRNLRLRNAAVVALMILTLASMIAAYVAIDQYTIAEQKRLEAEHQRNEVLRTHSRFLADQARQQTQRGDPVTGALLALHGLPQSGSTTSRPFVAEAAAELQRAVWLQREAAVIGGAERKVAYAEWAANGQTLLIFDLNGDLRQRATYNPRTGRWSSGRQELEPARPATILPSLYETSQLYVQTSPNGSRIIVPSAKGAARVLDAESGETLIQLPTTQSDLSSLQFSRNGQQFLATYNNGTSKIHSTDNGEELLVLQPADDRINYAVFGPDDRVIFAALRSGAVRFFDVATGEPWPKQPSRGAHHASNAKLLRLDREDRYLLSAGWDEKVRVVDLETFTLTSPPIEVGLRVQDAKFLADGMRIVVGFSDGFHRGRVGGYAGIWNVRTGELERRLVNHTDDVLTVDISPDGRTIVTGSKDATAILWNANTGEPLATLRGHQGDVTASRFSPDGRWLVTLSTDGTARIWEADGGLSVASFGGHDRVVVGRSADLSRLVLAADDDSVFIQDTRTGAMSELPRASTELVTAALFSPARAELLIYSAGGGGELLDLTNGTRRRDLPKIAGGMLGAGFSPDGNLIATAHDDGNVCLWRTLDESLPQCHNTGDDVVKDVIFSPDGSKVLTVVTGVRPAIVLLTDPIRQLQLGPSGPVAVGPPQGHRGTIESGAFSPDGLRVLTAAIDGTAIVWEVATGKPLHVLAGDGHSINHAVFGRRGGLVATASSNGTVGLWSTESGENMAVLGRPGAPVWRVAFSPDGSTIAAATGDGSLLVWAVDTAELAGEYSVPFLRATDVAFSSDERGLYVGYDLGSSAYILPYFPDFASLRDTACEGLPRTLSSPERDSFFVGNSEIACSHATRN